MAKANVSLGGRDILDLDSLSIEEYEMILHPQVGVKDMQGNYLENQQLQPDVEVYNTPEAQLSGEAPNRSRLKPLRILPRNIPTAQRILTPFFTI